MSPKLEKDYNGIIYGGAGRVRTGDPLLAKQVLYQLSYDPNMVDIFKERI